MIGLASVDVSPTIAILTTLDQKVQKRCLRKAATAGAQIATRVARALAPIRVVHTQQKVAYGTTSKGERVSMRYRKQKDSKERPGLVGSLVAKVGGLVGSLRKRTEPTRKIKSNYRGGLLRKSIGYKISISRSSGRVTAVVGARKGFKTTIGVQQRTGRSRRGLLRRRGSAGQAYVYDPKRTIHLVVKGARRGTRRSAPNDFLTPAANAGAIRAADVLKAEVSMVASALPLGGPSR
ncbi:MAG: hypothetical protein ACJ8C4_05750 [Gemmataceae bacterium]